MTTGVGVEDCRFNSSNSGRSLMIHARELSELKKSCWAVKAPTSTKLIVLLSLSGQPWVVNVPGVVPGVDTTSTEGESVATAPVPLGIALMSLGPVAEAEAERVCTSSVSVGLQVDRTSISWPLLLVMYVNPPCAMMSKAFGVYPKGAMPDNEVCKPNASSVPLTHSLYLLSGV